MQPRTPLACQIGLIDVAGQDVFPGPSDGFDMTLRRVLFQLPYQRWRLASAARTRAETLLTAPSGFQAKPPLIE